MSANKPIERKAISAVLAGLNDSNLSTSENAGRALLNAAAEHGMSVRDYLTASIDLHADDKYRTSNLNGFEAALHYLNLPVKDNLQAGMTLRAASDTFQTYPGTRALFPEVVDEMLRWKSRVSSVQKISDFVLQSRTITGNELVTVIGEDDADSRRTSAIAELGQIPIRSVRSSETSVRFYKHGSGYQVSYEFNRRASLDLLTPFAARVAREMENSRVRAATAMLINGDGVNAAAPVKNISAMGGTAGTLSYKALVTWLIKQAESGVIFDTIAGNVDMYLALSMLFAPTTGNSSDAAVLSAGNLPAIQLPEMATAVKFVLSTSVPANTLVGFVKGETLEELVEANSLINEAERAITNQSVTYVRTMNAGYKLAFADTRGVLNVAA